MFWFSLVTRNTFAVVLLEQGQYGDAIALFREIITEMNERADEASPTARRTKKRLASLETSVVKSPVTRFRSGPPPGKLFNRAFLLPQDEPLTLECISIVVLFNLGLAMHCKAIKEEDSYGLTKAFDMYQRAHKLSLDLGKREGHLLTPILTAAIHNMSAICGSMDQRKKARALRGLVSEFLQSSEPEDFGSESYEFFQQHRATAA